MSDKDGGTKERERLATKAGVSESVARTMSGADLAYKALLNATGQSGSVSGARLMQLHGGPA